MSKRAVSAERRSTRRDIQRLDLAVSTYGTIKYKLVSDEIRELKSLGCAFSLPNAKGPLKAPFGSSVQKLWVGV